MWGKKRRGSDQSPERKRGPYNPTSAIRASATISDLTNYQPKNTSLSLSSFSSSSYPISPTQEYSPSSSSSETTSPPLSARSVHKTFPSKSNFFGSKPQKTSNCSLRICYFDPSIDSDHKELSPISKKQLLDIRNSSADPITDLKLSPLYNLCVNYLQEKRPDDNRKRVLNGFKKSKSQKEENGVNHRFSQEKADIEDFAVLNKNQELVYRKKMFNDVTYRQAILFWANEIIEEIYQGAIYYQVISKKSIAEEANIQTCSEEIKTAVSLFLQQIYQIIEFCHLEEQIEKNIIIYENALYTQSSIYHVKRKHSEYQASRINMAKILLIEPMSYTASLLETREPIVLVTDSSSPYRVAFVISTPSIGQDEPVILSVSRDKITYLCRALDEYINARRLLQQLYRMPYSQYASVMQSICVPVDYMPLRLNDSCIDDTDKLFRVFFALLSSDAIGSFFKFSRVDKFDILLNQRDFFFIKEYLAARLSYKLESSEKITKLPKLKLNKGFVLKEVDENTVKLIRDAYIKENYHELGNIFHLSEQAIVLALCIDGSISKLIHSKGGMATVENGENDTALAKYINDLCKTNEFAILVKVFLLTLSQADHFPFHQLWIKSYIEMTSAQKPSKIREFVLFFDTLYSLLTTPLPTYQHNTPPSIKEWQKYSIFNQSTDVNVSPPVPPPRSPSAPPLLYPETDLPEPPSDFFDVSGGQSLK